MLFRYNLCWPAYWLMMVATLQLKAPKLIVYFVSFTVVIFTILNLCWDNSIIKVGTKQRYIHYWHITITFFAFILKSILKRLASFQSSTCSPAIISSCSPAIISSCPKDLSSTFRAWHVVILLMWYEFASELVPVPTHFENNLSWVQVILSTSTSFPGYQFFWVQYTVYVRRTLYNVTFWEIN